jgi:hypothetical protein
MSKASRSGKSAPAVASNSSVASLKNIQQEVEKWATLRKQAHVLCHNVVNLVNHSSYLSPNKLKGAMGEALSSTSGVSLMHDDLLDRSRALREVHEEMYRCLERMADMQLAVFPSPKEESLSGAEAQAATEVTYDAYCSLRDQLQQQTMLEMCIAEEFCPAHSDVSDQSYQSDEWGQGGGEEGGFDAGGVSLGQLCARASTAAERGDQDALTTMLACLAYPPYLRPHDLDAFVALPPS